MKMRLIVKTIIFIVVAIILTGLDNTISPIIANELAMLQMSNSQDSSLWIQWYSYLSNYKFLGYFIFALLLYCKEINTLINFIKEKINNEKTL